MKDILYDGTAVGKASIVQEGLYFQIDCICNPQQQARYKIVLDTVHGQFDLGTCLYDTQSYKIKTRIPVKKTGEILRVLLHNKETFKECFIPIHPDSSFQHISLLPHSKLCCRNGDIGIIYQESD